MSGGGTIKAALKALDYSDLSLSKWDGVDRLAEMVDFEDFEAVGQLALQIDKGRGKGLSYGPSGDGGYRNTALAKMIDLLKVHVEGFRTNRSNYEVIALWNVLGVAKAKEHIEAIGAYPDGRLNENVRRYIMKFDSEGLPPVFRSLHIAYLHGIKQMSAQPSAKITRRRAKETYNAKQRQKRADEDKGEGSSRQIQGDRYKGAGRPSWRQELNDSRATPKFSVSRSHYQRDERYNRAAQLAAYAPRSTGREIKMTSGFVVSDDESSWLSVGI